MPAFPDWLKRNDMENLFRSYKLIPSFGSGGQDFIDGKGQPQGEGEATINYLAGLDQEDGGACPSRLPLLDPPMLGFGFQTFR